MKNQNKKAVLLLLDGAGISPKWSGNAMRMNKLENFSSLTSNFPYFILRTDFTGSPNLSSAVCNARISLGASVLSDEEVIEKSVSSLGENSVFQTLVDQCRTHGTAFHLIGTLDQDNDFSNIQHISKILQVAKKNHIYEVFIHLVLKGLESSQSILPRIHALEEIVYKNEIGKIASIAGSNYLSGDDMNFQSSQVFKAVCGGKAESSLSASLAIKNYYKKDHFDNDIPPTLIVDKNRNSGKIQDFDSIIFFDTKNHFTQKLLFMFSSSMLKKKTNYPCYLKVAKLLENDSNDESLCEIMFERETIEGSIPEILSNNGFEQLYLTEMLSAFETTKGFSGFCKKPFPGVRWQIVPSVLDAKIDSSPQLSLSAIAEKAFQAIKMNHYDFITVSVPNADIFAHHGSIKNASNAMLLIDKFLGYLTQVCEEEAYTLFIASSHGACEEINSSEKFRPNVHTRNPVPFIIVDKRLQNIPNRDAITDLMNPVHSCFDIAPTLLKFFDIKKAPSMVGESLIK